MWLRGPKGWSTTPNIPLGPYWNEWRGYSVEPCTNRAEVRRSHTLLLVGTLTGGITSGNWSIKGASPKFVESRRRRRKGVSRFKATGEVCTWFFDTTEAGASVDRLICIFVSGPIVTSFQGRSNSFQVGFCAHLALGALNFLSKILHLSFKPSCP